MTLQVYNTRLTMIHVPTLLTQQHLSCAGLVHRLLAEIHPQLAHQVRPAPPKTKMEAPSPIAGIRKILRPCGSVYYFASTLTVLFGGQTVGPTARYSRYILVGLFGIVLLDAETPRQEQFQKTPVPLTYIIPKCGIDLPLDVGQAFAGPIFLIEGNKIHLFDAVQPADPTFGKDRFKRLSSKPLKGKPPASGMTRARVKWRDGALWMQAGQRIFKKDPFSNQWFLQADPHLEFSDFDVDFKGQILLIGTADPLRHKHKALLEVVDSDRKSVRTIADYPETFLSSMHPRLSPLVAAAIISGYESVQINEFIVLYNPMSRNLFVYSSMEGGFREIRTDLEQRNFKNIDAVDGKTPTWPKDLCWQILPKDATSAWLIIPNIIRSINEISGKETATTNGSRVLSINLTDATSYEDKIIPELEIPVFIDAQGEISNMSVALESYQTKKPSSTTRNDAKQDGQRK